MRRKSSSTAIKHIKSVDQSTNRPARLDELRGTAKSWDDRFSILERRLNGIATDLEKEEPVVEVDGALVESLKNKISELEARCQQLAEENNHLRQPWHWRLKHGLKRSLRNGFSRLKGRFGKPLFNLCRRVYRALPLSHDLKIRLRWLFLRMLSLLDLAGQAREASLVTGVPLHSPANRVIDFSFEHVSEPDVSIIIPVYNQVDYTLRCLRSIYWQKPDASIEIILGDDGSTDETEELVTQVEGLTYIRHEENLGFLKNCNAAAEKARGKYLYFLNNDTEVQPGFLDELIRTFETHEDVGLAGSQLLYADGTLQEAGGIIWEDGSGWNYGRGDDAKKPQYNYMRDVDYCSGCSLMIPKKVWEEVRGFDETFAPGYYEDTDLAFAVRAAGLRVVYQPLSRIVHYEGVSAGTDLNAGMKAHQVINQERFQKKWWLPLMRNGANGVNPHLACERLVNRRILIIDSVTPTPAEDAGSVRTFNLIETLCELGAKVTFIPEDNIAFMEKLTPDLQRLGVECLYHPYIRSVREYIEHHISGFDMVILERGMVAPRYIDLIRRCAPKIPVIFDTHDLHYLRMQRQAEVEGSKMLSNQAADMKRAELSVMDQSNLTLVVSQYEKNVLLKDAPLAETQVLPLFMETEPLHVPFEEREGILFIGGFRHPPNEDAVRFFVEEVWPLVKAELGDVKFHVIGSSVPPSIKKLASDDVIIEGFVEDLEPLFGSCRMSVAPLRFGAGVKGKVGTSLAYGLPSVISPIAQEGSGLVDERDVLVAEEAEDFARQIVRLYKDADLWEGLSERGLQFIENTYSMKVNKPKIAEMLERFSPQNAENVTSLHSAKRYS